MSQKSGAVKEPPHAGTVLLPATTLQEATQAIFIAAGLSQDHAATVAASLVEADLRGIHSHGTMRIPQYLPQLASGAINPRPSIRVIHDSGATALLDGDAGMGQVNGTMAMHRAIHKAAEFGIAAVAVRNSSHFGAAGYYAGMVLEHDMIGFASTNCMALMPAHGGAERRVGNNPIAWAIPSAEELPIVLDMAQSVVAGGKLALAAQAGQKIPLGWALDRDGNPTDDPASALQGMLVPIAGHKGSGLAIVMDILNGILSGSDFGVHIGAQRDPTRHENAGQLFMAIRIAAFVDVSEFKARTDQMIREVRSSPKAPGVERIYLPGEIEWELRQQRLVEGIPLPARVVQGIRQAARQLRVPCTI